MATIGIACGGTGGHLYPGLAVAEKLIDAGHQVRIYISNKEIDRTVLQQYRQYPSFALPTVGWPGLSPAVIGFCSKFYQAYRLCVGEIREHRLSAVLGMGGFTSAPLLLCASRRRIPTLLHESNAIPGKVTRLLATQSNKVLLGFQECSDYLAKSDCRVTGTPVRSTLKRLGREEAAAYWGLDPQRLTITVIGGSQGASGLNQMLIRTLPDLHQWKDRVQVIHQTGLRDVELAEANYRRAGLSARVFAFCDRMEMIYSMSDIMVARSGAASLTEISYFGLPSILVPYPHAAEDHQAFNARIFEKAGAAVMVREDLSGTDELKRCLEQWLQSPELRRVMAEKSRALGQVDAAERVAREVQNVL
jgi:UDP-N-acetylglucosamine--N-acetylmuramyl-(pentapeptide) pyrophosphoryl-undecaprenol N-acetylglucosamine transferase